MKKNELRALLAVTVIAVPLVFTTGCGKKTEAPADTVVTEAVSPTPILETVEEDLADEGIGVTPTPEAEETLDDSEMYIGDMYAVGEISVYAEPSEDAEVISTLADGEKVTSLGILHEAEFYKVSTDTLEGYVRTVDLTDENGLYDEEINADTSEGTSDGSTYEQESNNSLPSSSNAGGLTDEELQAILSQGGFGDPSYQYDPSEDGDYTFGESGASDGSVVGHIQ